jgi:CRP-like cAMP-binding protein
MPNFFDIEVTRNQYIIKEGDPADRIFIIKDGEFQVTKKLIHKEKEEEHNIQDILDNP